MKEYVTMKEIVIEEFLKTLKIGLGLLLIRILYDKIKDKK